MPATDLWELDANGILIIEGKTPERISYDYEHRSLSSWHLNEADEIICDIMPTPEGWQAPFPFGMWYLDEEDKLVANGVPTPFPYGAFMYSSIEYVSIPESVKYIGENAFAYTNLTKVRIASDCVYSSTSFPEGCEILFYD